MNVADSQRLGSALEHLGYVFTGKVEDADVIVLNTCVVRQSAEDKAYGRLSSLQPLKRKNPRLVVNLMGCLVGIREPERLRSKYPFVDVFSPPSDPGPLISYLSQGEIKKAEMLETEERFAKMDGAPLASQERSPWTDPNLLLPENERGKTVSVHVPIVLGCSHACTFCIIPSRRGGERSRPADEIEAEAVSLTAQGVKEITLLGQIVDRYGKDQPGSPDLAALLQRLEQVEGLERIRFLTSHPNYFGEDLIESVAKLPKVMPHIEIPIQSGDDDILKSMRRGYSEADYRRKVGDIRERIPGCSIATDIIVGFPGESEEQFMKTYHLLEDLRMDVAHLARYSTRPGTVAERLYRDDVPEEEKMRRFRILEDLQERISGEINGGYLGKKVDVLFEEKVKGRWRGRTQTNKLIFVESEDELRGEVRAVMVTWTGPWSMQAKL